MAQPRPSSKEELELLRALNIRLGLAPDYTGSVYPSFSVQQPPPPASTMRPTMTPTPFTALASSTQPMPSTQSPGQPSAGGNLGGVELGRFNVALSHATYIPTVLPGSQFYDPLIFINFRCGSGRILETDVAPRSRRSSKTLHVCIS